MSQSLGEYQNSYGDQQTLTAEEEDNLLDLAQVELSQRAVDDVSSARALAAMQQRRHMPSVTCLIITGEDHESGVPVYRTRSNWFKRKLTKAFLETYPFDGYLVNHGRIAKVVDGQPFNASELTLGLMLATFFGLPTRLDANKKFTFRQLLRNLVGGWTPVQTDINGNKMWTEKHRWQILAIPFKVLIILPLKLITMPFNFLINLVKLFTEFLPMVIRTVAFASFRVIGIFSVLERSRRTYRHWGGSAPLKLLTILGLLVVVSLPITVFWLASVATHVLGRAITSPLKNLTMSFHFGLKLKSFLKRHNFPGATVLPFIAGGFLSLFSMSLSVSLWAVAFPLVVGAAVANFPVLLQAATWVSQLPVLSTIIAAWKVSLASYATPNTLLAKAFIPLVTALSSFIGLQLSASFIVLGASFAYVVAFIGPIWSDLAETLSNKWALLGWKNYQSRGPLTWLASKLFPKSHRDFNDGEEFAEVQHMLTEVLAEAHGINIHSSQDGHRHFLNSTRVPSAEPIALVQRFDQLRRGVNRAEEMFVPGDVSAPEYLQAPTGDQQGPNGIGAPEYQQPPNDAGQSTYDFPDYQGAGPVAYK